MQPIRPDNEGLFRPGAWRKGAAVCRRGSVQRVPCSVRSKGGNFRSFPSRVGGSGRGEPTEIAKAPFIPRAGGSAFPLRSPRRGTPLTPRAGAVELAKERGSRTVFTPRAEDSSGTALPSGEW